MCQPYSALISIVVRFICCFSFLFFINKWIFCLVLPHNRLYVHKSMYIYAHVWVRINFRRCIRWIYKSADAISSSCCRKSFRFWFYSASFVCMFACVLLICFVCCLYILSDLHLLYTLYYVFTGSIGFFKISQAKKKSLISDICRHRLWLVNV